jgi:hypothetical protein
MKHKNNFVVCKLSMQVEFIIVLCRFKLAQTICSGSMASESWIYNLLQFANGMEKM